MFLWFDIPRLQGPFRRQHACHPTTTSWLLWWRTVNHWSQDQRWPCWATSGRSAWVWSSRQQSVHHRCSFLTIRKKKRQRYFKEHLRQRKGDTAELDNGRGVEGIYWLKKFECHAVKWGRKFHIGIIMITTHKHNVKRICASLNFATLHEHTNTHTHTHTFFFRSTRQSASFQCHCSSLLSVLALGPTVILESTPVSI